MRRIIALISLSVMLLVLFSSFVLGALNLTTTTNYATYSKPFYHDSLIFYNTYRPSLSQPIQVYLMHRPDEIEKERLYPSLSNSEADRRYMVYQQQKQDLFNEYQTLQRQKRFEPLDETFGTLRESEEELDSRYGFYAKDNKVDFLSTIRPDYTAEISSLEKGHTAIADLYQRNLLIKEARARAEMRRKLAAGQQLPLDYTYFRVYQLALERPDKYSILWHRKIGNRFLSDLGEEGVEYIVPYEEVY